MKKTLITMFENGTLQLLALVVALTAIFAVSGCVAVEVKDYGHEVIRDANGNPMTNSNGVVQTVHKGQRWHYNKNMVEQSFEEINFSRKPGDNIDFTLKNYRDVVSAELTKLVDTSFKGAAELAAKIGAAIATSGGSVAGEAGIAALKGTIEKYIKKGGDAKNATVTCKDGNCTISDGTVSETCTDCLLN